MTHFRRQQMSLKLKWHQILPYLIISTRVDIKICKHSDADICCKGLLQTNPFDHNEICDCSSYLKQAPASIMILRP